MATDASLRTGYNKSQTDTLLAAKVSTADIGDAETAAGAALNATIAAATTGASGDAIVSAEALALGPFRAALANAYAAPCVWYALGDSITEGEGATDPANRWIRRALAQLRYRRPRAVVGDGSIGTLPPYYETTTQGNPWTSFSGSPTPSKDQAFGLGRRAASMSSTAKYTYDFNGTSVDVFYVTGPSTGTMGISIDGGAVTNVSTTGSLADGNVWSSGALTDGAHTIAISVVSGTVFFTGIRPYDGDEDGGVHLLDAGHYGYKTSNFASASSAYWKANYTTHQPHLLTIALMANDYSAQVAPATVKTNLETIISEARARITNNPSIVLIVYPERGDVASPTYPWSDYVDVAWEIAAEDTGGLGGASGVAVFDMTRRMISRADDTDNDYGLYDDQVHPSDAGMEHIGAAFGDWLVDA